MVKPPLRSSRLRRRHTEMGQAHSVMLQRFVDLQRRHLGSQRRTVACRLPHLPVNNSTVHDLARHMLAEAPGPHSEAAAEKDRRLRRALDALE